MNGKPKIDTSGYTSGISECVLITTVAADPYSIPVPACGLISSTILFEMQVTWQQWPSACCWLASSGSSGSSTGFKGSDIYLATIFLFERYLYTCTDLQASNASNAEIGSCNPPAFKTISYGPDVNTEYLIFSMERECEFTCVKDKDELANKRWLMARHEATWSVIDEKKPWFTSMTSSWQPRCI
jgi:hypothetical protein